MGLPVERLIVGSNRNDVLTRFFESGIMSLGTVHPTLSPSMDIQVSSNFERFLFELYDRDGGAVAGLIGGLRRDGRFDVGAGRLAAARRSFAAARFDDEETLRAIAETHARCGVVVDPHTAVGLLAARETRPRAQVPVIALATADPAKFPDAVERAIGRRPALQPWLADLIHRPERRHLLPNDTAAVRRFIAERLPGGGGR
jgi:threonine synthase